MRILNLFSWQINGYRVKRILKLFVLGCVGLAAGCASVAVPPTLPSNSMAWNQRAAKLNAIKSWKISGVLGVRSPQNGFTASYVWLQQSNHYDIELAGPLGSGAIRLAGEPGRIDLQTSHGVRHSAANPELLLKEEMGWQLPVSNLQYWIRGIPAPNMIRNIELSQYNRLRQMVQQGWMIVYQDYMNVNGIDLPHRILLATGDVTIKIVINSWNIS